jgi:hypothetical protein
LDGNYTFNDRLIHLTRSVNFLGHMRLREGINSLCCSINCNIVCEFAATTKSRVIGVDAEENSVDRQISFNHLVLNGGDYGLRLRGLEPNRGVESEPIAMTVLGDGEGSLVLRRILASRGFTIALASARVSVSLWWCSFAFGAKLLADNTAADYPKIGPLFTRECYYEAFDENLLVYCLEELRLTHAVYENQESGKNLLDETHSMQLARLISVLGMVMEFY